MQALAGALLFGAGLTGCEAPVVETYDYGRPSPPETVVEGATVLGAIGQVRILQSADAPDRPGCTGEPELRLALNGAAAGPPSVTVTAGSNRIFVRQVGGVALVALVTACPGGDRVWLGSVTGAALSTGQAVPVAAGHHVRVTGWSRDGRRLLGVETVGSGVAGHRLVAVDVASGAVSPLGTTGWWVDELAGGALVVDRGDRVLVGSTEVTFEDGGGGARGRIAVSPAGDRVAIGTGAALIVATPGGRIVRWATEPVLGPPAWSADGVALAYVTGGGESVGPVPARRPSGPLRIVTATAAPSTVAPSAAATALAFAVDGATTALVHSLPRAAGVAEVAFPRWAGELPDTSAGYAAATVAAWAGGDRAALTRLTSDTALAQLSGRDPGPGPWPAPQCQVVVGQSYCLTAGPAGSVMLRVDDTLVAERAEHAVIDVVFDLPTGAPAGR